MAHHVTASTTQVGGAWRALFAQAPLGNSKSSASTLILRRLMWISASSYGLNQASVKCGDAERGDEPSIITTTTAFMTVECQPGAAAASADRTKVVAVDHGAAKPPAPQHRDDNNDKLSEEEIRRGGIAIQRGLLGILGEQVSVGMMLGYATGFAVKKIGRVLLGVVGTEIILLQYMSFRGWVRVNWNQVMEDFTPSVNRSTFEKIFEVLTYKIPFAASFTAGLYAGLKYTLV
mmetsp:Transcript_22534/g.38913  ORF Transcript_22534/g.38913 Transcript_22534/m.38913 type:complete len:233 (+) Transcript_22534:69-767(+)